MYQLLTKAIKISMYVCMTKSIKIGKSKAYMFWERCAVYVTA